MKIEVSNGELLDKYTILQIKCDRVTDPIKLSHAEHERQLLMIHVQQLLTEYPSVEPFLSQMKIVNETLWDIEDDIRRKEKLKEFDTTFIDLARQVYFNNDERANIKWRINQLTNSDISEIKNYESYK